MKGVDLALIPRASAPWEMQYANPPMATANDQNFIDLSSCSRKMISEEILHRDNRDADFRA
jgi:hypothetical protein